MLSPDSGACVVVPLQPKVQAHFGQCAARTFTCIDCSRHFDRNTYKVRGALTDTDLAGLLTRFLHPVQ